MSNKDSDELDNIIGELCGNPQTAEQDEQIHQAKQAITNLIKDLVQECKPEPEIECVCGEYGTEDCDKVWHMRMCGIDGYEQNILKALEEK